MLRQMMKNFKSYSLAGVPLVAGIDPVSVSSGGDVISDVGGTPRHSSFNKNFGLRGGPDLVGSAKYMSRAMAGIAITGTAYNVHSAYQEDGLSGAKDAIAWELASASAVNRFAYGSAKTPAGNAWSRMMQTGIKPAGSVVKLGGHSGMMSGISRTLGAGIGASIGQSVAGTPGAFAGAFIGAAPVRFAATHPLLAAGAIAGAGAAAVGYGAYHVVSGGLRMGASHRRRQRSIDTSGSMAAFMTSGAHTMRGRAVQAIAKSHMNSRSALGQEATLMHRPHVNFHSRYR